MEASTMLRPGAIRDKGTGGSSHLSSRVSNVDALERVGSALLGIIAVTYGARRKSIGGVALAVVGGEMIYRGVAGKLRKPETGKLDWQSELVGGRAEQLLHWR